MPFRRKKKEKKPEELRGQYRRKPTKQQGLSVKMQLKEGGPLLPASKVEDVSAGGVALSFAEGKAPRIAEGAVVSLIFGSFVHLGKVRVRAQLDSLVPFQGKNRYGFEFTDTEDLFQQCDAYYFKFFNRRRTVRVRLVLDGAPKAELILGPGGIEARIHDLSSLGIGIVMDRGLASMIEGFERLEIAFAVPRVKRTLRWWSRPVHATVLEKGVHFGALFEPSFSVDLAGERQALKQYVDARAADMARWDEPST